MLRSIIIAAGVVAAAACSHPAAGHLRFQAQAPVWKVDDARPLPKKPHERVYNRSLYHVDGFFVRRLTRAMDFKDPTHALDVNALDEAPDSTWFTNRIGVRDMTVEELRKGPNKHDSPFDHLPLKITGAKVGGTAIGFVVKDAAGGKYLLKFDVKDVPELETSAHIIVHRILWAAGYNVPEDHVGYLKRSDLTIAPDAKLKDTFGSSTKLTDAHLERALAQVYRADDGRYRVLLSRFIAGIPIGPYSREGKRSDDPNDRVPHEARRTVRGEVPLFSWLAHTDLQEDNTLDAFVPESDNKEDKRGHIVHYLIDFGKALGVMNNSNSWRTVGYTYRLDIAVSLGTFLTLGTWKRPWDEIKQPPYRGVALFEGDHFDPSRWKPNSLYWPFEDADKLDGFWGAKIAMRFTPELLAAAIDEAKMSDPEARQYLLDTLIKRQRVLGRYWFKQVSPLDKFTVTAQPDGNASLCFDDLDVVYGFEPGGPSYKVHAYDYAGAQLAAQPLVSERAGHVCLADVRIAGDHDGYTIVKIAALRGSHARPPVLVHVSRVGGKLAVIGLRRE